MNRRILLIDADSAFHTSVAKQLARFRFDIFNEPDGDRAHALAAAQLPALIIVAVDEPEKLGFKIFQKLRKGPTAKVPILLVTASMTPESFTKHRGLKVHADDYLDKRTQSDELLGKLEQLIGLGDPLEDDIEIPLEDDIPLVEGDMVLEETLGEDDVQEFDEPHAAHEFDAPHRPQAVEEPPHAQAVEEPPHAQAIEEPAHHEFDDAHNAGTRNMQVDELVEAEIDAGFAAMFGEEPAAEPAHAHPDAEDARVRAPIVANESVPVAIQDSGRREDEPEHEPQLHAAAEDRFDSFEEEPARPPSGSRTPIAIDDDMIPVEEIMAHEEVEEEREESTNVEAPVPTRPPAQKRPAEAPQRAEPVDAEAEHEFSMHDVVTRAAPVDHKLLEELSIPVAVAHVNRSTGDTMAPPFSRPPAPDVAAIDPPTAPPSFLVGVRSKRESMQPVVDLGLDEVAERAESEQSGVHDRRSLQRVGELERQVGQLKTELERARTAASEKAGSNRANEFVNLREQITTRDKELQKTKDELAARNREIKDAQEKARQALNARNAVESKASELDQLRTMDLARIAAYEGREKAFAGQVAALKDELDARTTAAAAAEQMRLQIERDLAAERARAAAGASDAERSLRLEREQLIGRHQGEIAAARGEAERLREAALATLRAELEADAAKATAAAIETARRAAQLEQDKAKAQVAQAHAAELEGLVQQYGDELATIEQEHAQALLKAGSDLAAHAQQHADALAKAGAGTEELRTQHAAALAALATEHAQQLADHGEEQSILAARARDAHDAELARVKQAHDAFQASDGSFPNLIREIANAHVLSTRSIESNP